MYVVTITDKRVHEYESEEMYMGGLGDWKENADYIIIIFSLK